MKKPIFVTLLAMLCFLGCATGSSASSEIVGIWQTAIVIGTGQGTETLQFQQDGSVVDSSDLFAAKTGTWAIAGNSLTITYPSSSLAAIVSFPDDNTMILAPAGGSQATWTRLLGL